MKRTVKLHQGQSPGDILVFSGAVRDLKLANPDIDILIDSPCPAIFDNNPHVLGTNKATCPPVNPQADNLLWLTYDLAEIARHPRELYTKLLKDHAITSELSEDELLWSHYIKLENIVYLPEVKLKGRAGKWRWLCARKQLKSAEAYATKNSAVAAWKRYAKANDIPAWEYNGKKKGDRVLVFTHVNDPSAKLPDNIEKFKVGYTRGVKESTWSGKHFCNGFHDEIEELLGVKVPMTSMLPEVFLSDTEKGWMSQVEQEENYRGKFWLINSGVKADMPIKGWGVDNWQGVVDALRDSIQFVQVGELSDDHTHEKLEGVIDLRGKTSLRQIIRLAYHAEGACSHVTFLMHLMAAYQKPCVVVAGGREPRRWEAYPNHRYLDTNGQLDCCAYGGCWQSGRDERKRDSTGEIQKDAKGKDIGENKTCKNMVGNRSRCMQMITPAQVAIEVMNYYRGGMLKF